MPKIPDFDAIASELMDLVDREFMDGTGEPRSRRLVRHAIVEQLRLIWNARGAVDLAKIDAVLSPTVAAPYVKTMNREIRKLDR
jgi:hypothetical protein